MCFAILGTFIVIFYTFHVWLGYNRISVPLCRYMAFRSCYSRLACLRYIYLCGCPSNGVYCVLCFMLQLDHHYDKCLQAKSNMCSLTGAQMHTIDILVTSEIIAMQRYSSPQWVIISQTCRRVDRFVDSVNSSLRNGCCCEKLSLQIHWLHS